MFSREMNPGLGRSGRVAPQLESLEDRCCPSTVGIDSQHILHLFGGSTDNTVTVRDDGHGDITVIGLAAATASHPLKFTGVKGVDLNTGSGNDHVEYDLTGTLVKNENIHLHLNDGSNQVRLDFSKGATGAKLGIMVDGSGGDQDVAATFGAFNNADLQLNANLGSGWDHFLTKLNGPLAGNSKVDVNVHGGNGVTGVVVQARGDIGKNAQLSVEAVAGRGDATLHVDYAGKVAGKLSVLEQAGTGWDWLESNIHLTPGSTGAVAAHVLGGPGADLLILMVRNQGSALKNLDAMLHIGTGDTVIEHTPNVKVIGKH